MRDPGRNHCATLILLVVFFYLHPAASWDGHSPSWWASYIYENWDEDLRHWDWIKREDDMPDVRDLLSVERPCDGTRWLNVRWILQLADNHILRMLNRTMLNGEISGLSVKAISFVPRMPMPS